VVIKGSTTLIFPNVKGDKRQRVERNITGKGMSGAESRPRPRRFADESTHEDGDGSRERLSTPNGERAYVEQRAGR